MCRPANINRFEKQHHTFLNTGVVYFYSIMDLTLLILGTGISRIEFCNMNQPASGRDVCFAANQNLNFNLKISIFEVSRDVSRINCTFSMTAPQWMQLELRHFAK